VVHPHTPPPVNLTAIGTPGGQGNRVGHIADLFPKLFREAFGNSVQHSSQSALHRGRVASGGRRKSMGVKALLGEFCDHSGDRVPPT